MKLGQNYFPKSSFLSTDKDLSLIIQKIMGNQRLLKMLYYTEKDCLQAPDLSTDKIISMLDKQIKIIPKIDITENCPVYIIITLDDFLLNETNPEFRDCTLNFDILCHPDHWNMGNFQLRPHKIAGEIDAMFNKKYLTGIGKTTFLGARNLVMNNALMGMTMIYRCVHGVEDQIDPLS